MLQLGQLIANSVATVAVGIGLTALGTSYTRNIPDPVLQVAQADGAMPGWLDPETTGAIGPKAESRSADVEATQAELKTGSTAWIDPPRRSNTAGRSGATGDQPPQLRLPGSAY